MKICIRILIIILLISLCVSCHQDVNIDSPLVRITGKNTDWMGSLDGSLKLTDLYLPGTHDSCANYDFMNLSSTAAAQDMTLAEQLESGVRFFDIRPCKIGNELYITHGSSIQHVTMEKVLKTFSNYLSKHSDEVVIVSMQAEWLDEGNYDNIFEFFSDEEIIEGLQLNSYLAKYSNSGKKFTELTINDCRGKIVLVCRESKIKNDIFFEGYSEFGVTYKAKDMETTWQQFQTAVNNLSTWKAMFISCYLEGQFGIPNIRIASSYMNSKLKYHFEEVQGFKSALKPSAIVCDHITEELCSLIIGMNNR